MCRPKRDRKRRGFTLVELVIVILIIGILAAIAAPKLFDTSKDARENGTRQSLNVLRNAIQLYKAKNGALPGEAGTEADLKTDLTAYLQGPFPRAEVGNAGDTVRIQTSGAVLTVVGPESWAYDNVTGDLIINHASYSSW
ncbi:MAG: type II secretion system protein [Planctomycetaceae bacterium]